MLNFLLRCVLVLGLLASANWGRAQCLISPAPASCPRPFLAIDVASGQEVQALCVGRPVRFELNCSRQVDPNKLYYSALPGTDTTPPNCDFPAVQLPLNVFTPTATGAYTIAELSNPPVGGGGPVPGVGIVYVRNFQVYASPVPDISLAPCAAGNVRLNFQGFPQNPYDQYFVQVNGGPLSGPYARNSSPPLFAAPAGSQVTIVANYKDNTLCGNQVTITVPTLSTQPLVIKSLTVQGNLPGPIDFTFSGLNGLIDLGGGHNILPINQLQVASPTNPTRFRGVVGFGAPTTYSQSLLAPGLYRLAHYDFCGLDSTFSEPVPTIQLSGASANSVNTLTWQAAGPVAGYTLLRNGTALATLPASATSYPDAAVGCGTPYTYRLQATTAGGSQSISNQVSVSTVSTLAPPAPLVVASFDLRNRVNLSAFLPGGAALPTGSTVAYGRQGGGANFTFPALPAPALLRDSATLADLLAMPACYAATVLDVCGNRSATGPATCPVLLAAEAADPAGATARLSWSALQGPGSPAQGASYRVLTLAPDGTVLAASAPTTALSYLDVAPPLDRQVLRYRIEASGAGLPGGSVSYSNLATVTRQPYLAVPNAFTPNGDGLNDVLELKGRYLAAFTFVVVDRNGQVAFRATDRGQAWDGTIQGHAPVNGAYVWRFSMNDEAGQPFSQTGSVTILK